MSGPTPPNPRNLLIFKPKPDLPPPLQRSGIIGWLRFNLFNGWMQTFLTFAACLVLYRTIPPLLSWAIFDAAWMGGAAACPAGAQGACWPFIVDKFRVLMVGLYPREYLWRPVFSGIIFISLSLVTAMRLLSSRRLVILWLMLPFLLFWLINGGVGLDRVDQSLWGGLMLSMGLALVGILVSLPMGICLALGRRSQFAVIQAFCIGIIEPVRGVPLITILFMASVMMPLFLPVGMEVNNLLRVQIGIILFSAAYMAEVVRGGLQGVPLGQYDAARSIGLNYWKTTFFIILPQALRHVVPSLIGRCIALFKDTSLVIIVGLLDFLGMIKASAQDPEWLGHDAEAYVFCALIYWIICFSMSRYGRSMEELREKQAT